MERVKEVGKEFKREKEVKRRNLNIDLNHPSKVKMKLFHRILIH